MNAEAKEVVEQSEGGALVAMVERLALSPDVDVEKLEKMLDMQERILDRNAAAEFAAAMTRVQAKIPAITKDAYNDQTRSHYATHEAIARDLKPIYTAEGFSISFGEGESPRADHVRIEGELMHSAGHRKMYHVDLPLDNAGIKGSVNKTGVHATGSSLMYGRRYLTLMIFDVATGDDNDGNQPVEVITDEQVKVLEELIKETGVKRSGVLQWCQIELLSDMPAAKFTRVKEEIEARRDHA